MNKIILILVFAFGLNVYSSTIPPGLSNFKIKKDQPSRVYFDSSEGINGSNTKGFIIGSRSISGVKIISGKTTGHYFTVSKAFTFWDNDLIRYEGGSNLQDVDKNSLNDFTLQYIHNDIPEPSGNGNVYYVSITGNNNNNGLSQNKSWRTITYAATKAKGGDVVYIKAGDYGKESVVINNSGSNNNPIKFIGYKERINDDPVLKRTVGMNFKSSEMPLLKNGKGTAINVKGRSFVILRNLQIDNYGSYGIDLNNSTYFIIDNVYVNDTPQSIVASNVLCTNNRVINCYVANSSKSGVRLFNKNNLIDNTWAISSKKASMDYYLTIMGGKVGTNNIIRNCYVNRFLNDSHLVKDGYLNQFAIKKLLLEHLNKKVDHGNRLWLLCNAEVWYRMFIEGQSRDRIKQLLYSSEPSR